MQTAVNELHADKLFTDTNENINEDKNTNTNTYSNKDTIQIQNTYLGKFADI